VPSVTVEKNYKWFAPLHLDESQIIPRRARARHGAHPERLLRAHPRLRGTSTDAPVRMYYLISKDVNRKNNFCRWPSQSSLPLSPHRSVSLPFPLVTRGRYEREARAVFSIHRMNIDWRGEAGLRRRYFHCIVNAIEPPFERKSGLSSARTSPLRSTRARILPFRCTRASLSLSLPPSDGSGRGFHLTEIDVTENALAGSRS